MGFACASPTKDHLMIDRIQGSSHSRIQESFSELISMVLLSSSWYTIKRPIYYGQPKPRTRIISHEITLQHQRFCLNIPYF